MSELKIYHCDEWHNPYTEFYLKSEADKVIAEKDAEIEKLDDCIRDYSEKTKTLVIANLDMQRREAHHKYKRCLAMARIAQDDWHLHNSFYSMGHREFEKRKCEFYEKWHKRWLKLAEKFKEAK